MKIAIVGGGPGGLYLAALMKQLDPAHEITVWERNAPDDTFGFGVVFSDETLGGIENADTRSPRMAAVRPLDRHRHEINGASVTVGGQGFAAMGRKELLQILQDGRAELGVRSVTAPRHRSGRLRATHDLVVGADGINSAIRAQERGRVPPALDRRATSTCGWAPTWSSRPSSSSSSRRRGAPCRSTVTRTPSRARPSSSRCTRTCGAGPASTRPRTSFPPGASDE